MQQANYLNCACMVRYSLLWTPWSWRRRQRIVDFLQCTFFLTPDCGSCTYHRQKGVAEAESRLGGEVLVRDEADPDLTAFGSVASRYRLWAAPATQDGFLSQIFYFHIVVPGRQRKKTLIISQTFVEWFLWLWNNKLWLYDKVWYMWFFCAAAVMLSW